MRHRASTWAVAWAAIALVALLLSACGKSAAQQFRDSLSPIQDQAQSDRAQISATLQTTRLNDRAAARQLDQEIASLAGSIADMTAVKAPNPGSERAFQQYLSAYNALVAALYQVAARVGHGSLAQVQATSVRATQAAGAVQRASDALESALGP